MFGDVNETRTEFGRRLARESGVPADVVVPIPDSGVCAAVGVRKQRAAPMRMGLIRNHYVAHVHSAAAVDRRGFGA